LTLGFGEDLIGGSGPRERFAAFVVGVDEDPDGVDQVGHAGIHFFHDWIPELKAYGVRVIGGIGEAS
jgi:hypothetical protein